MLVSKKLEVKLNESGWFEGCISTYTRLLQISQSEIKYDFMPGDRSQRPLQDAGIDFHPHKMAVDQVRKQS